MTIIYVDDELPAIKRFTKIAEKANVENVRTFDGGEAALEFAKANTIDLAFLDIEMPEINGIELAERLHKLDKNIKIAFLTAYDSFALEAFRVEAIAYLLKPFSADVMLKTIDKAQMIKRIYDKRVKIKTFGGFELYVDGAPLPIPQKQKEYLAVLVDLYGGTASTGYAISRLWEERAYDANAKSLLRMTVSRLLELLEDNGISHIISTGAGGKSLSIDSVSCDYFDLLNGDRDAKAYYNDDYMVEYSWAEETNAKLHNIARSKG